MTGFKDGAVGWDDDEEGATDDISTDEKSATSSSEDTITEESTRRSVDTSGSASRLPWIHARSSITDGRDKTVQLHLQDSTIDQERDGMSEVQQRLDTNVKKADLREAALLVGLSHLDEVAGQLRDWGYDY